MPKPNEIVEFTPFSDAERSSWWALLDIAKNMPDGWSLTGGGLIRLLIEERKHLGARATQDIDVVLDVRARRANIHDFYQTLSTLGFAPDGLNASGQNHRWVRGEAQIDVLVPSGLSLRTLSWNYPGFGKLLPTRGAQFVLHDIEKVSVHVGNRSGVINRPTALGALYGKCSALLNNGDTNKSRHITDIALLSQVLTRDERKKILKLSGKQRHRLSLGLDRALKEYASSPYAQDLERLQKVVNR